ncbi:MAG: type II secretion system protein [Bacilli bacterium]|nr:type II secretion system protein [Bacilli bacterium]
MNNKGYTLVELLATIVILGVIMGIATYGVIGVINRSKEKSERIFLNKLEDVIKTYIDENRFISSWSASESVGFFQKCRRVNGDGTCYEDEEETVNFSKVSVSGNNYFYLKELEQEKYIQGGKIINPKNKEKCLSDGNETEVLLYKDSDSVYYYYVDLKDNSCDINNDNTIITNIPKNMCDALGTGWRYEGDLCVKS